MQNWAKVWLPAKQNCPDVFSRGLHPWAPNRGYVPVDARISHLLISVPLFKIRHWSAVPNVRINIYYRVPVYTVHCTLRSRREIRADTGNESHIVTHLTHHDLRDPWTITNVTHNLRPNSITLSSALASWSQTWFPTCRRQIRAISTCRDISTVLFHVILYARQIIFM